MRRVSWLESELHEQPAALARLLERQSAHVDEVAAAFRRDDVRYIVIASRGSSSNAARYAQYLLGRAQRVPVMFATPSLYTIYEQPPRLDGAVVLGISQSGASPDVISVLAEARRQGRPTVSITNGLDSPIAKESDAVLLLEAGEERSVAATKTYMNSLGAALAPSAAIDGTRVASSSDRMPDVLERQIELSFATAPPLDSLTDAAGATVVARGVNFGTAYEIALKIRELSGPRRRGVLARGSHARAGRGDQAGLAGHRGRADGPGARERRGDPARARGARRARVRRLRRRGAPPAGGRSRSLPRACRSG